MSVRAAMSAVHPDPQRRAVLAALASLPMAACAQSNDSNAAEATVPMEAQTSRTLVAYLSLSGQTRVIAGVIQRALSADLFGIRTATPYQHGFSQGISVAHVGPPCRRALSHSATRLRLYA